MSDIRIPFYCLCCGKLAQSVVAEYLSRRQYLRCNHCGEEMLFKLTWPRGEQFEKAQNT